MKKLLIVLLALGLTGLWGCSSDSENESVAEDTDTSATTATATTRQRVPDEGVPVISKPSGVRYQDLIRGDGKEVVDSMLVKYEYRVWFADREGLTKERSFHSSVASEQPYFGQVGVTLIEGLSDGLIGMRAGGMRRIYIPSELGYGEKPPFGGNNLIFEIWDLREASPQEVNSYQTGYNNLENMKIRDSLLKARGYETDDQ